MRRVTVIVEGATEEAFLGSVVAPSLWTRDVLLTPVILGVAGRKGGNVKYARVRKDIILQLKQDRTAFCSTMLDLYGLKHDFPGTPLPPNLSGLQKAERIELAVFQDIAAAIPELRPDVRFIPYIQPHEYEGLLFSDPEIVARNLAGTSCRGNCERFATLFQHQKTSTTTSTRLHLSGSSPYTRLIKKSLKERWRRKPLA